MREIIKKNKKIYDYRIHKISDNTLLAIVLYIVAIIFLVISIFISYLCKGNAPTIVAGVGISSLIFNVASMATIINEIYVYDNYHREIGVMLILQLILFSIWIFIIG